MELSIFSRMRFNKFRRRELIIVTYARLNACSLSWATIQHYLIVNRWVWKQCDSISIIFDTVLESKNWLATQISLTQSNYQQKKKADNGGERRKKYVKKRELCNFALAAISLSFSISVICHIDFYYILYLAYAYGQLSVLEINKKKIKKSYICVWWKVKIFVPLWKSSRSRWESNKLSRLTGNELIIARDINFRDWAYLLPARRSSNLDGKYW